MKYVISLITLLVILTINAAASPNISVLGLDGDTYRFGKVTPDSSVISCKVKFVNTGTDSLIFKDVKPACGCTSTPLDKYRVSPGDTATLTINFRTRGYKGYVKKAVTIYTNAPGFEQYYIFFDCNIVYPISFSPNEYIVFFDSQKGESMKQSVDLVNTTANDITVTDVSISSGEITSDIEKGKVIPKQGKIKVNVTYLPQDDENQFHGTLSLKTDCPSDPVTRIFIKGIPKK